MAAPHARRAGRGLSEHFPRIASLRSAAALRARFAALGIALPCDDSLETVAGAPLAAPLALGAGPDGPLVAPNRFVVQPMEGWDGTADGLPSELTRRRWRRFGASGAGWIWGGEAAAVHEDARANPHQLVVSERSVPALAKLREEVLAEAARAGHAEPVVGLQLTHSGRWSMPQPGVRRPRVAYRHPLLDRRVGIADDGAVLADAEVDELVGDFARAAACAQQRRLCVRGREALPRLSAARVPVGARATRPLGRAESRRTHAARARDRRRRARRGAAAAHRRAALGRSTWCRTGAARAAPASPRRTPCPTRAASASTRRTPPAIDLAEPIELVRRARCERRRVDQRDGRESLLRAPRTAAGTVPALRRLPAAGGSAGRRCAPAGCGARDQGRGARGGGRVVGLDVSPGVASARRAGVSARRASSTRSGSGA